MYSILPFQQYLPEINICFMQYFWGRGFWKLANLLQVNPLRKLRQPHTQKNGKLSTVTERDHLGQCTVTFLEIIGPAMETLPWPWYTCQSRWPRRTNQEGPRSWANWFFKIEGFAGKRSLLSPPPPPSFHLFALAQFFAHPECEKLIRATQILVASYGNACYAG